MNALFSQYRLITRINLILVCSGLLLALLVTATHIGWHQQEAAEKHLTHLEDTVRARLPRLASALWDINPSAIRQELEEIAKLPGVSWIDLSTPLGQTSSRGRTDQIRVLEEKTLSLDIYHPESKTPLGNLQINVQYQPSWQVLQTDLGFSFVGHLLQIVVMLLLLNYLLRRYLFRPIGGLTQHLQRLNSSSLSIVPAYVSPSGRADELDKLAAAITQAQHNLLHEIDRIKQAEARMREELAQLERETARRAGESVYLSGMLKQLLRLSSDFLILPPQQADKALRAALQEISTFLGLDTCFIVSVNNSARAEIRCLWRKETLPVAPLEFFYSRPSQDYAVSFSRLEQEKMVQLHTAELTQGGHEARLAAMLKLETLILVQLEAPDRSLGLLCGGLSGTHRPLGDIECKLLCIAGNIVANLLLHLEEQAALQRITAELEAAREKAAEHPRSTA